MADRSRVGAIAALKSSEGLGKLIAMMGLCFLVIFMVGVVRPVRDALALSGLASGDFYQVYFVSAVVVLFVPLYNRLADRIAWKRLIPSVALFFAASMVAFRFMYRPEHAAFGLVFYGWYDLMVAALITQFYMSAQMFYNARDAKRAFPLVIAAGSLGAAVGGGVTAFFAQRVGAANLLLVAAAAIVLFAVGITLVWRREDPDAGRPRERSEDRELSAGEIRRIFSNPQVRLIAVTVLLTVLVKQFVDYEYKTLIGERFPDFDDASGFLGLVDAATQWLPILVLVSLRPILKRWGAGVAVLIFPVAMILATGALAVAMTLPVAVFARSTEKMFRYSAERAGREILYLPVPDEIKLRSKAYIDVAVEKGIGKVLSGILLAIPALLLGSMAVLNRLVVVAVVGLGLSVLLLAAFLRVRKQYVRSLASSIEGRFASLRGTYVSLAGTGAMGLVSEALRSADPLKTAFALELVEQADEEDVGEFASEIHGLLRHESADIRVRALDTLVRVPNVVKTGEVRGLLEDGDPRVREAVVRTLVAQAGRPATDLLEELLAAPDPRTRSATLACLATDISPELAEQIATPFFEARRSLVTGPAPDRLEVATAAGIVPNATGVVGIVRTLMQDDDDAVAAAAITSAGRLRIPDLVPDQIAALGGPRTRHAARAALAGGGDAVLGDLLAALNDRKTDPRVRRNVPGALSDIPTQATVEALIASYMLPETDQVLDNRALAALARLRAQGHELDFPRHLVLEVVDRELAAAGRYRSARVAVEGVDGGAATKLLRRALAESESERREALFRWLGLLFPQTGVYRSQLAIESGIDRPRANALEWLESTIGHTLFERIKPVFDDRRDPEAARAGRADRLRVLWDDEDVWIARCALWASAELSPDDVATRLNGFETGDPGLERSTGRLLGGLAGGGRIFDNGDQDMDLIEKVFLLQNVDLLSGARSQQLALLASIAREVDADADRVLLRRGDPPDALYVVIRGEVALEGVGNQAVTASAGDPFGTWALISSDESLVQARTTQPCRLLKIDRADFRDLLVDHPELGLDLLQGLARRVRALIPA